MDIDLGGSYVSQGSVLIKYMMAQKLIFLMLA